MALDLTPYATLKPFMGPLESWLPAEDAQRMQAYQLYEAIYRNVPDSFRLIQRGEDMNPIYIPSAKTLVEAKNRFLAKRWTYALDPKLGSPAERQALDAVLTRLFRREQVWTKFATQKRYGLIRGDSVWQITADENKPAGKRLNIYEVDPASYFPIEDPWNPEKVLGCHLVDPVEVEPGSGKTVIKRQTYRKTDTGRVTYELSWWESGGWDDRPFSGQTLKKAQQTPAGEHNRPVPPTELPETITALPVYHVKNSRTPGASFGTSELEGFERIIAAINQSISDEELALALEGLGLYWTNSGPPVDDDGNETNWRIGPGWVVEIDPETTFGRTSGVNSVAPNLDHIRYLEGAAREASGVPDIAVGKVDTAVAESGIALAFHMAPILSGNEEKEQELLSVMDHLLYDLGTGWLPAYEDLPATQAQAVSIVDDPLPVNRKQIIDEVIALLSTDPPLISAEYARQLLSEKLGYEFASTMGDAVVAEAEALAKARNQDPFAARVAAELQEGE